ncbi:hypothetical protein JCM11641_001942 [Rhodosporidiobolus odoratus]
MQAAPHTPIPSGSAPPPPPLSTDTPTPSSSTQRPPPPRRRTTRAGTDAAEIEARIRRQRDEWTTKATSLDESWVVESDMDVLQRALSDEPSSLDPTGGAGDEGVEKIRAVSDFAPIREKIRRGPKRRKDVVREGWAYHVSRWPLLFLIFTIIFIEFLCYLLVRQMVNVIEFFSSWHGERGRLRVALRKARTFEEWKQRALSLDSYLNLSTWKKTPQNAYYDAPLVRRVLRALKDLREKDDAEGVAAVLHAVLRSNFAGTESFRLYSETYYGTKEVVQEYVDEVTRSIEYIRQVPPSLLPPEDKADFFRSVSKNLGASALCLSGGASFGYYHFGVVRALLDQDLLPRVVTGTSAGAIVAAMLCTRTNPELQQLLTPVLADRISACSEPFSKWIKRAWKTGARFDTVEWARKASFFTMGSMTFREAYERTGRVLNVSVIPYDTHSPTKLLNYLTAPDCVIYTAVIASAAVPGILNPVVLLTKDRNGKLHPWEFQGKHKDGSLRVDIPLHSLHLLYNVNFSIVSQVNPHIHLFHFAPRGSPGHPVPHRKGRGWRGGFWLAASEQFWKVEMVKWFRIIRDLELLPELGGQNWSAVFLQKFEGTVTIWPRSRIVDWFRILTDPDRDELARMIRVGQMVTWPKIKMIENRLKIERQIDLGRAEVRQQLASGPERPQLTHTASSSSSFIATSRRPSPHPRPDTDRDAQYASIDPQRDEDDGDEDDSEGEQDIELREVSAGDNDQTAPTPAKRRQAILAKLGLGRVAGRGSRDAAATVIGGGEGEAEERYSASSSASASTRRDEARELRSRSVKVKGSRAKWTDESDWTSGGESADGLRRSGGGLRRRFSMSNVADAGRRRRAGGGFEGFSSDEEGVGAWR